MHAILTRLAAAWQRFTCRHREARRLRQELRQLQQMNAQELRDIGFSHPTVALAAAADARSCCI